MPSQQITLITMILLGSCACAAALTELGNPGNVIGRMRGNIFRNLTKTQQYENNIVTSRLDSSAQIRKLYRNFRELYSRLLGGTGQRTSGDFLQKRIPNNIPFPCRGEGYRSRTIPTSVHQLRPGDIDIVAAMGDSLTAATAANSRTLLEVLVENRGVSWSIGGQGTWRSHLTLPNILKVFNPKLFGYSLSDAYNVHRSAQFNVAENIAATSDMPYNAEKLVKRMKLDARVDMQNHWKLLTLMIGGNDFCSDICYQTNATLWMNESQERNLIKTLRYLRDNMPRTLVNLVPTPLVNLMFSLYEMKVPFTCSLSLPIECSCLFGPKYSSHRSLYRQKERNFAKIMENVSFLPEFTTDNFAVVYQPSLKDSSVFYNKGKADLKIMAADCLHLSQKGHAVSANALWNNMMQRVGQKSSGLLPLFKEFRCPTKTQPYILTNRNSGRSRR
ncbi:phospholipase B1, membrane-associated-like [Hermetia illucens]|nr:phospholipase B1, membrane-associated-like [Hermetia illucens]XP_037917627.1 phospholipase B1, membrane-associated-like [Hermetia illucens]